MSAYYMFMRHAVPVDERLGQQVPHNNPHNKATECNACPWAPARGVQLIEDHQNVGPGHLSIRAPRTIWCAMFWHPPTHRPFCQPLLSSGCPLTLCEFLVILHEALMSEGHARFTLQGLRRDVFTTITQGTLVGNFGSGPPSASHPPTDRPRTRDVTWPLSR